MWVRVKRQQGGGTARHSRLDKQVTPALPSCCCCWILRPQTYLCDAHARHQVGNKPGAQHLCSRAAAVRHTCWRKRS